MPDLFTLLIAFGVPCLTLAFIYLIPPGWVTRLVRQTPEQLATAIKQAYPSEEIAQIVTASAVNTALVLSQDENFAPKILALSKELTPIAVQSYLSQPTPSPPSPGQALAQQRWGTRGVSPPKIGGGDEWWQPLAQQIAGNFMQNMMSQRMGGGNGNTPAAGGPPALGGGSNVPMGGSPI